MVVLTDTPATARAAAAAAAVAAAAAAAAAAEAASDSSSSGGGSPMKSLLSGRRRKSKRFESPLLQPIETDEGDNAKPAPEQQQNGTHSSGVAALLEGSEADCQQQQQTREPQSRTLLRNSSGGGSKGRVGFHESVAESATARLLIQVPGVGLSDSSSSLAQLRIPQQQEQQQHEDEQLLLAQRTSSGGGSGSSKGGLHTRSRSGPVLMSLTKGQEGDGYADIINGPEGVAVPIGELVLAVSVFQHQQGVRQAWRQ